MHVLFLAPDTHIYNHGFLRGLRSMGARVSAIGPARADQLSPGAKELLDGYRPCADLLGVDALAHAASQLATPRFDRIEVIDEPLVEQAAALRERFGVSGLRVATARLCRDKVAMKALLREHGVPCANSGAVHSRDEAYDFAAREGYPLVVKPVAGFGSLQTFRVNDRAQLDGALATLRPSADRPVAIEEYIDGHEGFYDAICDGDGVRHDFAAHYYPGCLEANRDRSIAPQIAVTNRLDEDGYDELRAMGRRVIDVLGIRESATHMEWFFGSKGLKFSEIGARPAGEMIWDRYRVGNEIDVYREWALAVCGAAGDAALSRRFAVGSVQVRPSCDGVYVGHRGLSAAMERCREAIYDAAVPKPGAPTQPLDKGWFVNTWFRLRHENYDELRRLMDHIGATVRADAR